MNEFQLLIKPSSYDCNLNCEYCFYKRVEKLYPEIKHPRMSDKTLEVLIKKYLGLRLQNSVFCWQGGEPTLMGLDFYKKVVQFQQKYGIGGQLVGNVLQTNGILIDEDWAKFLHDYKVFVGLSLDGPENIHDHYRRTINGKGTWKKVMKCVKILQDNKVEFNILCVLSKANVNHVKELYQFFSENDLNYLQFIPALECTNNKMAPYSPTAEEYGKFLCEIFDLWKKNGVENVHFRTFEDIFSLYLGLSTNSCPFGKNCSDYLVIEWNGDVFPCDFFVKSDLKLGNIINDDFSNILKNRPAIFSNRKKKLGNECLNCHWKNICHGGCLKDRDFCENTDNNRSYYCKVYKLFFTYSYEWFLQAQTKFQQDRGITLIPQINKINRNDYCPCGSGLKYKKCHGKKQIRD